jgi:O-antigen/teichoic acid export membrane protein
MNEYREVLSKVKQLFVHKIAEFTIFQTSQILVYALTTLSMVTFYTNYTLIFQKITKLVNATLGSNLAGIGNVIAENDPVKINKVFWEFNALFFWIAGTLLFSFYYLTEPFIAVWLGEEFILPRPVFLVMLFNLFVLVTRQTVFFFLNGYALFKDIWAPWAEGLINLGVAIGVGYYYGLLGVVLGLAVSSLLIVVIWKPYFLYREGFRQKVWKYWLNIGRYLGLLALSWAVLHPLATAGWLPEPSSYLQWFLLAICIFPPFGLLYALLMYLGGPGMKDLYGRMMPVVIKRFRK